MNFINPLSAERVVSGGGEYPGRSDFAEPERLVPSHDARRLRAAGGQRVVRCLQHDDDVIMTSCSVCYSMMSCCMITQNVALRSFTISYITSCSLTSRFMT